MKRKYKNLIPVALIFLMAIAWYQLNNTILLKDIEYNTVLEKARKYAESGIMTYAERYYLESLSMRENIDVRLELADYYKKNSTPDVNIEWCEAVKELYPKNVNIYERLLGFYLDAEDYKSCFSLINVFSKRNLKSEYIDKIENQIKYKYTFASKSFDDVSIFKEGICAVKSNEKWGFISDTCDTIASCSFKKVSAYLNGLAAVVDSNDNVYYIDTDGVKAIAINNKTYSELGMISKDGILTAVSSGKYMFLNSDFEKLFGDYDFASAMNDGIAAVKKDNIWKLIGSDGKDISTNTYLDIKLDESNTASKYGRVFVKNDAGYTMLDNLGNKVSDQVYEDARLFSNNNMAAVKIGGKWGFVDLEGKVLIEPQYEDARSFSQGLAAVKIGGKWGFIGTDGKLKIDAQFYDAKDFTDTGKCFVNIGTKWQILELYKYL